MVDFKKRLGGKSAPKQTDPIKLYETLDLTHDKGPLRPAQYAVLETWAKEHSDTRDVIVKLHTGQGKTLVGLLLLQAQLNRGKGPAVYLCPDNFLIEQTRDQARQFGISTCHADPELPDEFLNGERILVTSVQKLFNGKTKFRLEHSSVEVGTLLMDDAHACADEIREACRIRIGNDEPAYSQIRTLFAAQLEQQGIGTFADVLNGKRNSLLPVPYWAWIEREADIAKILSANSERQCLRFTWPLLKNGLGNCQCVISGAAIEIEPYIPPLAMFGSYSRAKHRVFMSATVTDDAFLVKGLQLKPETIINPITFSDESWSGEKMILVPSLIHDDLGRDRIVQSYGGANAKRKFGIVALASAFAGTKDWSSYGSLVTSKETIVAAIQALRAGTYERPVVLVNRYDGIDLPDDTCRILVFDGLPFSESLIDLYEQACRPRSVATLMRTVRTVEQGMGRSVRGHKDYSVIMVIGPDLVRLIRDRESRKLLSPQMATQIEIGLQIADMARQEIEDGEKPEEAFVRLVRQCLGRDDDWKTFYAEEMSKVRPRGANERVLRMYAAELEAERASEHGDASGASEVLQRLLDEGQIDADDRGWYLQHMARFHYRFDRAESSRLQIAAHSQSRLLLRPEQGITVRKLTIVSQGRMERIADWIRKYDDYAQLNVALSEILGRLAFGVDADKFEQALDEISRALGFLGERPDKEWKGGPDNLWALDDRTYILWECKNEVLVTRKEINKSESEQMNRSSAWFEKYYPGMAVSRVLIHPTNVEGTAASFTDDVLVMREPELRAFSKKVAAFFKSCEGLNFKDLSISHLQKLVDTHALSFDKLLEGCTKKIKRAKSSVS